jgi:outer membrane receptor protein involved in Fe transport
VEALMRRLAAVAMFCLFASALPGQSPNARVTGRVTDPSRGIILNAKVTLINQGTNIHYTATTNQTGNYYVTELMPGTYRVEVEAIGFKSVIKPDVILHVQDVLELNFELAVGSLEETITVEGGAPTVQLTSSAISAVVDFTTVRELPLNGRSWTDLATLQPGVAPIQTQNLYNGGTKRGNRGYGSQLAVSGARPVQNNYRLDGISVNDYANGGPSSVTGGSLGVDAVQEFSVLTSNYSAEYGKTSGGVINAISRSGTNQFHGSAYEFIRNSALDTRNFFDPSQIPPFKRNQFGASGGGPIIKDHTFIFADYEGLRQSLGTTNIAIVPSPEARKGILSNGPPFTVDAGAQLYLALYPQTPSCGADTCPYKFTAQQVVSENFFTTRLDHKFSEKDSLFGTYVYDKSLFTTPDNLNDVLLGTLIKRQILVLEETHIFGSALVNSVRFGLNRVLANTIEATAELNPADTNPALSAVPGQLGPAELQIGGGVDAFGGPTGGGTTLYRWNTFQGYDDAFLTRGRHGLKFGVAVERDQDNQTVTNAQFGQWKFSNLSAFLHNQPHSYSAAFPGDLTGRGARQTILGAYVQDDWRLRPNLTLNLGLRYEMSTIPTEVQGKLSNLYSLTDVTPHLGDPLFLNPTLHNFEPRVGFAWDPFGSGRTAIRGGFGMTDSLPLLYQLINVIGRTFPFFEQGTVTNDPVKNNLYGTFPGGGFSQLGLTSFQSLSIEPNPHRNYVMQWNLNVQRELTPNVTALVGYVGSHGVHQPFRSDDANIVLPILTSAGYVWPFQRPTDASPPQRINPNVGDIRYQNWGGSSSYNALETAITKRMSHGLEIQGSFTWSKSIDNNSGALAGDTFTNSISSLPWFNLALDRAASDFNVGRTLVISGTWQVPHPESLSGPLAWVASGYELGLIFKANDGTPFSATLGTGGDPLGLTSSDPWDFPNRLTGSGCGSLVNPGNPNNYIKTQCFALPTAPSPAFYAANCNPAFALPVCINLLGNAGRNILTGPGLTNLDFSLFKNNPIKRISESFNVQFRAEIFNILNHANFAVPVTPDHTDIFDSSGASLAPPGGTAGLLTSTATPSRQLQFALKFVW